MDMILTYIPALVAFLAQASNDIGDGLGSAAPYQNWQIILGFLLPLAIQAISTHIPDRQQQALAAFAVSAVAAIIGMYIDGSLMAGGVDLVTTPLKVMVAVIAFYKGFWQPVGVTPSNHR